jgi:Fur family ferric uptake transcriptional regulator
MATGQSARAHGRQAGWLSSPFYRWPASDEPGSAEPDRQPPNDTAEQRPRLKHADELKSSGLKATLPRIKILEVFQRTERRHMTAEDVFKALLVEGSDVGLATVYRVLMQFEQAGLLTRSNFESGKSVFELNAGEHHDHLVCLDCGRVEEFYDSEIESRQRTVALARGFELQEHSLSLYARCSKAACPYRTRPPQTENPATA